jgi:GntR family transcriptional regulator
VGSVDALVEFADDLADSVECLGVATLAAERGEADAAERILVGAKRLALVVLGWDPVDIRSLSLPVSTRLYPSHKERRQARSPMVIIVTIDPLGPTPVYVQLANLLRAQIESGKLRSNRPIPSEAALQQEHGVARGTARRAVAVLREEGLVVTVKGRGTYVAG